MVLPLEDPSKTMQTSFFNNMWANMCYGKNRTGIFHRKLIVNSGAIFTSSHGFETIAAALHSPCPNTQDSNFHGVDQVVLNWLVYSGELQQLNFDIELQPRGRGIVNTLNYLWPKTPYVKVTNNGSLADADSPSCRGTSSTPCVPQLDKSKWNPPWTFHNNDGSLSRVVHQYDREKYLQQPVDRAADEYIKHHFPDYKEPPPPAQPAKRRPKVL